MQIKLFILSFGFLTLLSCSSSNEGNSQSIEKSESTIVEPPKDVSTSSENENKQTLPAVESYTPPPSKSRSELTEEIKIQLKIMEITCYDAWEENDILYFAINENQTNNADGLAQSFAYSICEGGYKGIVLRNTRQESIGRARCK